MLLTHKHPTKKAIGFALFSGVAGFCVSFTLFLFLTFNVSLFGDLILNIAQRSAEQHTSTEEQVMLMASATTSMTSFWWWSMVAVIGIVIAIEIIHVFGERNT
jgi:hypothetical protein